jgi:ribosomal protein S18 acetylase RimI-like enzyme
MSFVLRDYQKEDAAQVNRVALAAFDQYKMAYSDWPTFSQGIGNMSALAAHGEIIVAQQADEIVGAVAYVGPGQPKSDFFDPHWPIIRMLVVQPEKRGQGIGRALTQACIDRAMRDGCDLIALHTTPIMQVALALYLRMGFVFLKDARVIRGIPYGVYIKRLAASGVG